MSWLGAEICRVGIGDCAARSRRVNRLRGMDGKIDRRKWDLSIPPMQRAAVGLKSFKGNRESALATPSGAFYGARIHAIIAFVLGIRAY